MELLRRLLRRLNQAWEALPREARWTWWVHLLGGLAAVELFTLALVWAGRALQGAGLLDWEAAALCWVDTQPYLSFSFAMWLEGVGNGFVLWILVLYVSGVAAWRRRPLLALTLLTGYTLMYLPIATGWLAWDRARPTLVAGGLGAPGGIFRSYPSGHTVQAVFAYGYLAFLWLRVATRRGERVMVGVLFLLALLAVTVGRLRLGAHWPSDLVAGAAIGGAWLMAALLALRRAERARGRGNVRPTGGIQGADPT